MSALGCKADVGISLRQVPLWYYDKAKIVVMGDARITDSPEIMVVPCTVRLTGGNSGTRNVSIRFDPNGDVINVVATG